MLSLLQSVSFEINRTCQLAELHKSQCPISVKERYDSCDKSRTITDDAITNAVDALYNELGFRGWINWHYFNDPAIEFDRLESLVPRLRALSPKFRTSLFTNGIALPQDLSRCRCFDKIWLKDYMATRNWSALRKCGVQLYHGEQPSLDDRLTCPRLGDANAQPSLGDPGERKCNRLFDELIVDNYGYGRICTDDWLRRVDIGNIWDDGIRGIAEKFLRVRSAISTQPMSEDAPDHCKTCGCPDKFQHCVIDRDIWNECQKIGHG